MNIVYLVGNGFDISFGLKTSPGDFLNSFIESYSDEKENSPSSDLAKTIREEGVENWGDFERKIGEYSCCFGDDDLDDYLNQVNVLMAHLHSWLKKQDQTINEEIFQKNSFGIISSLKDFRNALKPQEVDVVEKIRKNHNGENWFYSIASFNYTSVLERLYKEAKKSSEIIGDLDSSGRKHVLTNYIYVHEALDGVIVTGVDNPAQVINDSFRENDQILEVLVKEKIQRILASDNDLRTFQIIGNAEIICVFGMSMGITDRRWWRAIADRLTKCKESVLIIFSYEYYCSEPHTPVDYYNVVNGEKEKFFHGAGLNVEEINLIKDKVFIVKSGDIFRLHDS